MAARAAQILDVAVAHIIAWAAQEHTTWFWHGVSLPERGGRDMRLGMTVKALAIVRKATERDL
jgi:hypothetical protein